MESLKFWRSKLRHYKELLSIVVRAFKARVSRRARQELKVDSEIWQHNYYDRVIRDGREFSNAVRYIAENPVRWEALRKRAAEDAVIRETTQAQHAAPLQKKAASIQKRTVRW